MAKERLLEKIAKKLSNQKYITRYHNTTNQGVRNMLNNGIKPVIHSVLKKLLQYSQQLIQPHGTTIVDLHKFN